jgi:hypothetical protein
MRNKNHVPRKVRMIYNLGWREEIVSHYEFH